MRLLTFFLFLVLGFCVYPLYTCGFLALFIYRCLSIKKKKLGLNFCNFQRISYFSPSKWSKKYTKGLLSKPFSFFYQQKSLPISKATLLPKISSPTIHQIKQKSAATKCELSSNVEEYDQLFLLVLYTCIY